jgi:DNA topoisomerase VI subunit B
LSDYIETIAAKRYRNYLREEERKTRRSEWTQHIIAVLLWLVKLITNILERVGIKGKSKRVIEKVIVE